MRDQMCEVCGSQPGKITIPSGHWVCRKCVWGLGDDAACDRRLNPPKTIFQEDGTPVAPECYSEADVMPLSERQYHGADSALAF